MSDASDNQTASAAGRRGDQRGSPPTRRGPAEAGPHTHSTARQSNRLQGTPGCCRDDGWVYVELSSIPTVRPCETHRLEQFTRWRAGGFRPTPFPFFLELPEAS